MYPNTQHVTKHRSTFLHGYYTKSLIKSNFYTKTLKGSEEIKNLWQETEKLNLEDWRNGEREATPGKGTASSTPGSQR